MRDVGVQGGGLWEVALGPCSILPSINAVVVDSGHPTATATASSRYGRGATVVNRLQQVHSFTVTTCGRSQKQHQQHQQPLICLEI
jgi:hypothetical protein